MIESDIDPLFKLVSVESDGYLKHFRAFCQQDELADLLRAAKMDAYFVSEVDDEISGCFFLRGLDAGFARPSFGIYVASQYRGIGLARCCLDAAVYQCSLLNVKEIFLKVDIANSTALRIYTKYGFQEESRNDSTGEIYMSLRANF